MNTRILSECARAYVRMIFLVHTGCPTALALILISLSDLSIQKQFDSISIRDFQRSSWRKFHKKNLLPNLLLLITLF